MITLFLNTLVNKQRLQNTASVILLLVVLTLYLLPSSVGAFAGLGGYISEKMLGDGTNEVLQLGNSASGPTVLGASPQVTTLTATNVTFAGATGTATLRGNLTSLNGFPQADTWFVWGYDPTAMTNTTATVTVFAAGTQTASISGISGKQRVYYQFRAGTDGTSNGATQSFIVDVGFSLLDVVLPILIALIIFLAALGISGSPLVAFWGTFIGLIAFFIVRAIISSM